MNPTSPDELFIAFQQAVAGRYSVNRELGRDAEGSTHLDLAAEVSAEVERLIAAHADVERTQVPAHPSDDSRLAHFPPADVGRIFG